MMNKFLVLAAFFGMSVQSVAAAPIQFSVVPQFSTMEVAKTWNPVLSRLEAVTGLTFELVSYPNIPAFEKAFMAGVPDIAYMNPYHAVMAHDAQGYQAIIRDEKMLAGLLLVRKDDPIQKLEDLANQKIAFPAPNAFGASLWIRANLTNVYRLPFEAVYVGTHQNTFRQVIVGDVAAGGGVTATLQKEAPEIRDNLRVLYTTPNAAPHPVMVHSRIDEATRKKVQSGFLAMAANEEDQKLLAAVQLPKAMPADYNKEYLPLKALNVQSFVQ